MLALVVPHNCIQATRRRHFQAVCEGHARRSRQDWANTSVAAIFADADETRRVRLHKTTIQMQRELLRRYGSVQEAFVSLSQNHGAVRVSVLATEFCVDGGGGRIVLDDGGSTAGATGAPASAAGAAARWATTVSRRVERDHFEEVWLWEVAVGVVSRADLSAHR
jgi:hypothetical protein